MPNLIRLPLPVLLAVCTLCGGAAAGADFEFAGIIEAGGNSSYGLDDPELKVFKWVSTGQVFQGWTVGAYDEKKETLLLLNGGVKKTLKLKDAVIKESAPDSIAGNVVIKIGDRTINQSLTLQANLPSVIPLGDGTQLKVTLEKQPSGDVRYELSTERVPGADGQGGTMLGSSRIDAGANVAVGISVNSTDGEIGSFAFTPKAAAAAAAAAAVPDAPAQADATSVPGPAGETGTVTGAPAPANAPVSQ